MLSPFATMLGVVGQQCWELLANNVESVYNNNVGNCWPTMLGLFATLLRVVDRQC